MIDQAFQTLEYDKLRQLIAGGAQTPMGRARLSALSPFDGFEDLSRELRRTAECVEIKRRGAAWSFNGISDPSESLARLGIGGATLEPLAILALARLCERALYARAAIFPEREAAPLLWESISGLPRDLQSLVSRISSKILPNGEIDDRSSPELARIRSEINRVRARITKSLENLMRRSEIVIQDDVITVRNDRFVIPVKSEHRGRVSGVSHGFSSSGATAFIEPLETIEANNELQALRENEEREIARILASLSAELRSQIPALNIAANVVELLDFLDAKAAFLKKFECVLPDIDTTRTLGFSEARHPLLEESLKANGGAVVPISFRLDERRPVMVISGANAGGKTVALKTAGLLSLMALSGLPVPAREARVPFYLAVLADIGDHQSIATNLSTFSAHVANISRMLKLCETPSLVLLDEVGTGTDPEEGSALGVAVVDYFRQVCGAHVLATTHYRGLKVYASNEDAVLNASVDFDEKTLNPTYKLLVGLPGSSSGLEIARRFGFPDDIVSAAAKRVDVSSREASEFLRRTKLAAEDAEALRLALEEERAVVAEKYASLDEEATRNEHERQRQFEQQLLSTIEEFEQRSLGVVQKLEDRVEKAKIQREAEKRMAELKREAKSAARTATASRNKTLPTGAVRLIRNGKEIVPARAESRGPEFEPSKAPARPITIKDRVRLRAFGSVGIVDALRGDEAEVSVGSLRLREKIANLELLGPSPRLEDTGRSDSARYARRKGRTETPVESGEVTAEINVIGRTTDEATDEIDKFLDQVSFSGGSRVRIIHGHGTGALRRAVANLLRDHPHVERFAAAPEKHGGAGATVAELKQ